MRGEAEEAEHQHQQTMGEQAVYRGPPEFEEFSEDRKEARQQTTGVQSDDDGFKIHNIDDHLQERLLELLLHQILKVQLHEHRVVLVQVLHELKTFFEEHANTVCATKTTTTNRGDRLDFAVFTIVKSGTFHAFQARQCVFIDDRV